MYLIFCILHRLLFLDWGGWITGLHQHLKGIFRFCNHTRESKSSCAPLPLAYLSDRVYRSPWKANSSCEGQIVAGEIPWSWHPNTVEQQLWPVDDQVPQFSCGNSKHVFLVDVKISSVERVHYSQLKCFYPPVRSLPGSTLSFQQ